METPLRAQISHTTMSNTIDSVDHSPSQENPDRSEIGLALLTAMTNAVKKGEFDKGVTFIEAAKKQGVNMVWSASPISWAIWNGQESFACHLIGLNFEIFDLHRRDAGGRSLLHAAALNDQTEACVHLVRCGVDMESRDNRGDTPLICACLNGQMAAATVLMNLGSDINAKGYQNNTPLHCAAFLGDRNLCSMLLTQGADWQALNNAGLNPVIAARLSSISKTNKAVECIEAFAASKLARKAIDDAMISRDSQKQTEKKAQQQRTIGSKP